MLCGTWLTSIGFLFASVVHVHSEPPPSMPAREARVVHIPQGPVRGYKDSATNVYSFKSIPYATAPTGRDKFKAPLPPPTWSEPLEAVDKGIVCPQNPLPTRDELSPADAIPLTINENCLLANVYVPETDKKELPVVVFVHGGAFQFGLGDYRIPYKLISENNIIVVTFNYRLGVHGYLCLGTEDIPGNAGMKDHVAFLLWVKQNINYFGGNHSDVTLSGCSSGAASVDLLMSSKSTEGLFHKAIIVSGSSLASFAVQSKPIERAKSYAKILNFTDVDNIQALQEFFKTIPLGTLMSKSDEVQSDSSYHFTPCVESSQLTDPFLTMAPIDIIKYKKHMKIPVLYGVAVLEGSPRTENIDLFNLFLDKMETNFSMFLPADLKFQNDEEKEKVAKSIKEFYFGKKRVDQNITGYINYFGDETFTYPLLRTIMLRLKAGYDEMYLHQFTFFDEDSPPIPHSTIKGSLHCAQSVVIALQNKRPSNKFKELSAILRNIWSTFIKTGKPVSEGSTLPPWPQVGENWAPHMSVGNEIQLKGPLLKERANFWEEIYSRYYERPVPPTPWT